MFKGCKDGRHKYKPRYDSVLSPDVLEKFKTINGNIESMHDKIYICDVCIRCGDVAAPPPVSYPSDLTTAMKRMPVSDSGTVLLNKKGN